ncbi:MAG: anhydro-N-acetylmuramic acid kinase [Candidatus Melainabacteria bacterium]|nr:anhydro-N-acetylmuramic acid kinase [Candidatus Melainabacteria bacterium]
MKNKYVIGLNSGTSLDGVDVALVRFRKNNLKPIFVDGIVLKYPRFINVETLHATSLQEISQLNFLLGEIFANAALTIIRKNKLKPKDILLIASHGQTICHHPNFEKIASYKIRSTFQIGESFIIAQRTGIKTISNFREADIAAGGQGAPLMPYLDWVIFNNNKNIKAVLNIGGISNITVVGNSITPIAFDIGPGNALIDLISRKYFKKGFDKDGNIATRGKIFFNFIERALKDSYFKKKPPKSTGKEYFNEVFIKKYFSKIKRKEDKIATVTYFSAKVIEKALKDFISPKYKINELVISGGGVRNKTLIKHFKKLLPDTKFCTSNKYGLPYKYKEAILFALLGYTCHLGKTNNIPSCTGAKTKTILGKIVNV